ncbi:hypothetical protein [Nevskia soli]|uniref:hypothetical protein n=1 Tax=Nevskia soli TaxID=418856 RepID=UPI0004A6C6A7|nr:hypothetical protein [Nevskia soli]
MPSILTHPLAPAAQVPAAVGNTPKYLVRSDGMVTVYTAALAKLPGFTPTDVLPAAHVAATRAAAQRDAVTLRARQAHQARMEALESARRERVAAAGKGGVQAGGVAAGAGSSAVVAPVAAAAVSGTPVGKAVVASTAVVPALDIGSADKAALKTFFAQHGVKADLRRPVEELRAVAHEAARKGRAAGGA